MRAKKYYGEGEKVHDLHEKIKTCHMSLIRQTDKAVIKRAIHISAEICKENILLLLLCFF